MSAATLIYPHQLFTHHPAIEVGRTIYLIEEPLFLTEFPTHTQKLLLHRLSMQEYAKTLRAAGHSVIYLDVQTLTSTESVFEILKTHGVTTLHIVDTTDYWLEQRISKAAAIHDFALIRYESPLFILSKDEAVTQYQSSKKHMAHFYKKLRLDKKILLTNSGEPIGGEWSFDSENRKKIPKGLSLPMDITHTEDTTAIEAAHEWLKTVPGTKYGASTVWVPWTRSAAKTALEEFIEERLHHFGDFEDALVSSEVRLFHSALSPLINIGLLSPREVIDAVILYGKEHAIPLNNIEGFVRQVIGWREFIRASYESDGALMRTKNFWKHRKELHLSFWDGTTGILPIDIAIGHALNFGYAHHIERLMVLGNFMLLTRTDPDDVYQWFMAMFVDAYDWVMVPNVYGMSQFADGGIFATKPYISGSAYIKKMSNYESGDWEELWTALYWKFIDDNSSFFSANHRLSMMPRLLEKMSPTKREQYRTIAQKYLQ